MPRKQYEAGAAPSPKEAAKHAKINLDNAFASTEKSKNNLFGLKDPPTVSSAKKVRSLQKMGVRTRMKSYRKCNVRASMFAEISDQEKAEKN